MDEIRSWFAIDNKDTWVPIDIGDPFTCFRSSTSLTPRESLYFVSAPKSEENCEKD
jgi:hypothetical protein